MEKEQQIGPRKFVLIDPMFDQITIQIRNEDNKITDEIFLTGLELGNLYQRYFKQIICKS